ncbi:Gpi16p PIG-T family with signal peptide and transmembrane domain [Cryptosporidium bovis]|uniref:Gpi16p PIG-T family with signal peptide and transmembrane domain n=1 Tax=Cryptosporidium bovis TaxID=310047 RepID=UPI00351A155D|nr:Gpi16p PIG-T family with signal peptide and transmembrane domain [Cryptosporidium bovis]
MILIFIKVISVFILLLDKNPCSGLLNEKDIHIEDSNINDKYVIHRLPHKNRYLFRYNINMEVGIDQNGKIHKHKGVNFIPNEFLELSKLDFLEDLFVISVQGVWRDENWGEPPINIYPTGLTFDFRYKDSSKHPVIAKGIWNYILNCLSNFLCSSLDVFKNELYIEKNCVNVNVNYDTKKVICTNHDDTLCMDTLVCWKRMLPCFSFGLSRYIDQNGILGKLPLDSFITSSYKSIGFRMKRISDSKNKNSSLTYGESKTVFTLFLETVLNGEDRIPVLSIQNINKDEFNLWCFHKLECSSEIKKPCPAIGESKLYFFVESRINSKNETLNGDNKNLLCRNVYLNKYPLKEGEFIEMNANNGNNYLSYLEIDINKIFIDNNTNSFNLDFFQKYCNISIFKDISSLIYPAYVNSIKRFKLHGDVNNIRFLNTRKHEYIREVDMRRSYTNAINELGEINSIWTQGSLVIYMNNNINNQTSNKNITLCHWEKIPKFINLWFHKTKILYSNKKEITDIYEDIKNEDVVVLYSNKAMKYIGLDINNSGKNTVINFCTELPPKMNLVVIFYFHKLFLPLNYYGAKSQRGQITPPSVTFWNVNNDDSQTHTIFHKIHIIPTILADHTMAFNVIATTSAFIIFGFITTTKFIQLNEKNVT